MKTVRLDKQQHQKLREIGFHATTPIQELVKQAIQFYLINHKEKQQ